VSRSPPRVASLGRRERQRRRRSSAIPKDDRSPFLWPGCSGPIRRMAASRSTSLPGLLGERGTVVNTPDRVSDVLAFVAKHAEFTNTILFAKDVVPEIRQDETKAIAAVMGHVKSSYVALLSRCRDDLTAHAHGDASLRATMER